MDPKDEQFPTADIGEPEDCRRRAEDEELFIYAFVAGMKWWEYESRQATAWPADVDKAEAAAKVRFLSLQPNH